jgi:hypothetical protein
VQHLPSYLYRSRRPWRFWLPVFYACLSGIYIISSVICLDFICKSVPGRILFIREVSPTCPGSWRHFPISKSHFSQRRKNIQKKNNYYQITAIDIRISNKTFYAFKKAPTPSPSPKGREEVLLELLNLKLILTLGILATLREILIYFARIDQFHQARYQHPCRPGAVAEAGFDQRAEFGERAVIFHDFKERIVAEAVFAPGLE